MKKIDFKSQLKNMDLEKLKTLRAKKLDYMLSFIAYNDKEAQYIYEIDDAIKKIQLKY